MSPFDNIHSASPQKGLTVKRPVASPPPPKSKKNPQSSGRNEKGETEALFCCLWGQLGFRRETDRRLHEHDDIEKLAEQKTPVRAVLCSYRCLLAPHARDQVLVPCLCWLAWVCRVDTTEYYGRLHGLSRPMQPLVGDSGIRIYSPQAWLTSERMRPVQHDVEPKLSGEGCFFFCLVVSRDSHNLE